MAMGDGVASRLGTLRDDVEQEIASVSLHSRQLETSTGAAQKSLEVLFASLPRAHDDTREMKATIEGLGLAAGEQAGDGRRVDDRPPRKDLKGNRKRDVTGKRVAVRGELGG